MTILTITGGNNLGCRVPVPTAHGYFDVLFIQSPIYNEGSTICVVSFHLYNQHAPSAVGVGVTTCNPEDKYDMYVGMRQAFKSVLHKLRPVGKMIDEKMIAIKELDWQVRSAIRNLELQEKEVQLLLTIHKKGVQ